MKLYGIKNCDTVKKARKFLDEHDVAYEFIDLKAVTLDAALLAEWLTAYPEIINKRSTTYRQLKGDLLAAPDTTETVKLVQQHQTVLKRPILVNDDTVLIGFDVETYRALT